MPLSKEEIEQIAEANRKLTETLEQREEQLNKTEAAARAYGEVTNGVYQTDLELISIGQQRLKLERDRLIQQGATTEQVAVAQKALEDYNEEQKQSIKNLEDRIALEKAGKTGVEDLGRALAGITPIIGGNADITQSYASKLIMTVEQEGGLQNALARTASSWKQNTMGVQGALNIYTFFMQSTMALIGATIKLSTELVSLNAEFNKATGQSRAFNLQLQSAVMRSAALGVSTADTAANMTDLTLNMTDFTSETEATQNQLIDTVGVLGALGVSAQTTTKNLQFMTTSLAMSAQEAEAATRQLFTAAQELKVGPGEMADEFAAASPKLAKFGKQSVDTFIDLKEVAKGTGIELQTLLGITEQFDTFEGAADRVGQLNAMLGGPFLNTIDMVSVTDPAERMLMLRDAVADAGVAYEDMGYYQKQALAAAAGVEVGDLGALMAGDLEALGLASSEAEMRMEDLAAQTAFTKDLQQELSAAFLSVVASLAPVLQFIQKVVALFNYGIAIFQQAGQSIGGFGGYLFAALPGVYMLVGAITLTTLAFIRFRRLLLSTMNAASATSASITQLTAATASLAGSTAFLAAAQQGQSRVAQQQAGSLFALGPAGGTAAGGIAATGTASGAAVGPTLAFGAAALMVGAGILLAAGGLALFVASFSLLNVPQMIGAGIALAALGTAIYFTAPAFAALGAFFLTPPGIALGIGLLVIGASALMASVGIAAVVASFALLFAVAPPSQIFLSGLAFLALAGGLLALGTAMTMFSTVGSIGVPLLMGVGLAVLMIGAGIGVAAAGMSSLLGSFAQIAGIGSVGAQTLREMADAINEVETDKAVTFSMTMKESARFVEALAALGTAPNQAVAVMGGGGGGAPTIVNVESVIHGDMRKLFDVIDSRVQKKLNEG